jgi:hypothetical protein
VDVSHHSTPVKEYLGQDSVTGFFFILVAEVVWVCQA